MGSVCEKLQNDKEQESYVGRTVDLHKARDSLKTKIKTLGVFGSKLIGKSRFLSELIHEADIDVDSVTYYDFVLDDILDLECQYDWLKYFYRQFGTEDDKTKLRKRFPDGTSQCGQCEQCRGHKNRCSEWTKEINRAVKCLTKRKEETLLILDNIDELVVATDGIKDDFLSFIQMLSSNRKVQVIVTSTNTIKLQGRFEAILLGKIDQEASLDLLYECVEIVNDRDIGKENGGSIKRCFNTRNKVFTPGNEACIKVIAKLCEGLPMALKICGTLLTEDNYLFTPADAVQLLILSRVLVLSPENAPASDRLDLHKEKIEQLKKTYRNFYEHLNTIMTSDGCTIQEANTGTVSDAQMKQSLARPLINQSLLSHKDQQLHIHGVLRECVTLLQVASLSTDPKETQEGLMECIKANAKLTSLDIPDTYLNDARQLESYIQNCFSETHKEEGVVGDGRTKATSSSCQPEYSSTSGPRAISYQTETSEKSCEKLEQVVDREIDTEKEHLPDLEKQVQFSRHQTADETERLDNLHFSAGHYMSDQGSLVCQPDT